MRVLRSALVCLCLATPVSAETLYGLRSYTAFSNESANVLVSVDTENGATGVVGRLNMDDYKHVSIGIAGTRGRSLTGLMWDHYEDTARLVDIDPLSGQAMALRDLRPRGDFGRGSMRGLAATRKGQLLSTSEGRLVRINPLTGRARLGPDIVADHGPIDISDLSFGGGKLFGASGYDLYEINRRTGFAEAIGLSMFWQIRGLAYTRGGNYGVSDEGVLLDMRDFVAEPIAPVIPVDSLTALRGGRAESTAASRAPAPVPIPAAGPMLALAASGLFASAIWRRKKGAPAAGAQPQSA